MEGVRNVLKVSELNMSMKERAYQKSLRGKQLLKLRDWDVEIMEKEREEFRDIVKDGTNDVCMWYETCERAEKIGE